MDETRGSARSWVFYGTGEPGQNQYHRHLPGDEEKHSPNAGSRLGHRRRRWPNLEPALLWEHLFRLTQPLLKGIKQDLIWGLSEAPWKYHPHHHTLEIVHCFISAYYVSEYSSHMLTY